MFIPRYRNVHLKVYFGLRVNTTLQTAQWLGPVVFYYDALLFWRGGGGEKQCNYLSVYDEQGDM